MLHGYTECSVPAQQLAVQMFDNTSLLGERIQNCAFEILHGSKMGAVFLTVFFRSCK